MKKQKDIKSNLVSVRVDDKQLTMLQEIANSGKCQRQTLSSALQFLINSYTIKK